MKEKGRFESKVELPFMNISNSYKRKLLKSDEKNVFCLVGDLDINFFRSEKVQHAD